MALAHEVFISYSHHDKSAADATCASLETAGIRCWIAPRDILPGVEWGESIIEAIDHAAVMVLVFSSNANGSPQVRREVERAVHKEVTIMPVRIEATEPTLSLAYFLAGIHWLDALTPPLESHLKRLATSIKERFRTAPHNPTLHSAPTEALSSSHFRTSSAPRQTTSEPDLRRGKVRENVHNEAYAILHIALLDPSRRGAAKHHPVIGPILKRLTNRQLDLLRAIMDNTDGEAYSSLISAILDPSRFDGARNHPVVGPILKRLTIRHLSQLRAILENQTSCVLPLIT